jgi:23S rRNA pseudouridine1911/1915/1917 synthase
LYKIINKNASPTQKKEDNCEPFKNIHRLKFTPSKRSLPEVKICYIVEKKYCGALLLKILKEEFHFSTHFIRQLKTGDYIFRNAQSCKTNERMREGDALMIHLQIKEDVDTLTPENIPLEILYEDECLIAINKKPNQVVHPTRNYPNGTLANGLLYYYLQHNLSIKVRPVSRLDKDTSGILLFAKNSSVQTTLISQMKDHSFIKEYIGVVSGILQNDFGTINLPIKRREDSIIQRETSPEGAPSITHYQVIKRLQDASYVRFELESGRTHQIRVHCQAIGHPLVGDSLYSNKESSVINRQALHAYKNTFIHPLEGKRLTLYAPIPEDIKHLLASHQI